MKCSIFWQYVTFEHRFPKKPEKRNDVRTDVYKTCYIYKFWHKCLLAWILIIFKILYHWYVFYYIYRENLLAGEPLSINSCGTTFGSKGFVSRFAPASSCLYLWHVRHVLLEIDVWTLLCGKLLFSENILNPQKYKKKTISYTLYIYNVILKYTSIYYTVKYIKIVFYFIFPTRIPFYATKLFQPRACEMGGERGAAVKPNATLTSNQLMIAPNFLRRS